MPKPKAPAAKITLQQLLLWVGDAQRDFTITLSREGIEVHDAIKNMQQSRAILAQRLATVGIILE